VGVRIYLAAKVSGGYKLEAASSYETISWESLPEDEVHKMTVLIILLLFLQTHSPPFFCSFQKGCRRLDPVNCINKMSMLPAYSFSLRGW
jgi:hypothetical protein